MQPQKTEAIVIRRTNYGEADRIVQFLTPGGRVSAMAKGVRRPKSKLAGGIELFAINDITVVAGRGSLSLLTSARMQRFFSNILHDYDRMQVGYDATLRVARATETIAAPEFYSILRDFLVSLDDLKIDTQLSQLWFYLQLAGLLGNSLNLATDIEGQELQQSKTYEYDFTEHALCAKPNGSLSGDHIKLLRLASVKKPAALSKIAGTEPILAACISLAAAQL